MIVKTKDKLTYKKFGLPGTGGQCIMTPKNSEKTPYFLYNIGGSLTNLIVSVFLLPFYLNFYTFPYLSTFLCALVIFGVVSALINALPLHVGGIPTDGMNILYMKKSEQARRAFVNQLAIVGAVAQGSRLRDLPGEIFEVGESPDLSNPLVCGICVMKSGYFQDKMELDKAREYSEFLLANAGGMAEVHKNELRCELLFYEIIGQCRSFAVERIYTKPLQKYIKASQIMMTRRRLMYAYQLLFKGDKQAAARELSAFERSAARHPYPSEIDGEWEMIRLAYKKHQEREDAVL